MAGRNYVRVIHALPVFALTDEPGWIILTRKKKSKVARFFTKLDETHASWEPPVKSWFVTHEKFGEAIEYMELATVPNKLAICQECSTGMACGEWVGIEDGGFLFRGPEEVTPPDRSKPRDAEADNTEPPVSFWEDFQRIFFGPSVKNRPWEQQAPPMPSGMPPQEAAKALGIPWPCTWEQMSTAFKAAAMRAHPDHGGSTEEMAKINIAREVLTKHFEARGVVR